MYINFIVRPHRNQCGWKMEIIQDPLAVVDRICGEMAASRGRREHRRDTEDRQREVDRETTLSREALERHVMDDTMARDVSDRHF